MRAVQMAVLLLFSACDRGGEVPETSTVDFGTIDGQPAPIKRTPDRLDAIPDAFRGRWAAEGNCGSFAQVAITVERDQIQFWESFAVPTYILRAGAREVSMELDFTGEGETWTDSTTLALTLDDRLRRADPDGTEVLYTRCPKAMQ